MDLNKIFKQLGGGEPNYFTPIAVVDKLVNQDGGMVVIGNPPFEVQRKPRRKGWTRHFKISHLYFYISNCRMKKRPLRDLICTGFTKDIIIENKRKLYERQGCCCPHCGQHFEYDDMELHHVLPVGRFPELSRSIRNSVMLCRACHKEVHCNPFLNIQMMKQKAEEMGIDLSERYNQSGADKPNINNDSGQSEQ